MGARSEEDLLLGGDLLGRGRSRVELVSQLQEPEPAAWTQCEVWEWWSAEPQ